MNWSEIRHFARSEFTEPDLMDERVVMRLDRVREAAGVPIYVTSSYRHGDDKSHGRGLAVDISDNREGKPVSSRWRAKVLPAMWKHGFPRIGVYDRHMHGDIDPTLPPDVIWWGVSD